MKKIQIILIIIFIIENYNIFSVNCQHHFKAIVSGVMRTKIKGFPSFDLMNKECKIDYVSYKALQYELLHKVRENCNILDAEHIITDQDIVECVYPYQLSNLAQNALVVNNVLKHDYEFGKADFDEQCKKACIYSILGQMRRLQEISLYVHPELAFQYLSMYPLKSLYKPYMQMVDIIQYHDKPWKSCWSAEYHFLLEYTGDDRIIV